MATSRAPLDACSISALRPAVSATAATRRRCAARRWKGDDAAPARSRARVSTNPDERPGQGEAEGHGVDRRDPAGDRDPQPTTTTATVSPKRSDLEQPERPEGRSTLAAERGDDWASPPTSTCTLASRTVIGWRR